MATSPDALLVVGLAGVGGLAVVTVGCRAHPAAVIASAAPAATVRLVI
jgi:hypothetical protein